MFVPRHVTYPSTRVSHADPWQQNTVVFKEYETGDDESNRKSWMHEVKTFMSIDSHENIVKYLGSFEQAGRGVIILEYANGGSLHDLLLRQRMPGSFPEVLDFWKALVELSKGICSLHCNRGSFSPGHTLGW